MSSQQMFSQLFTFLIFATTPSLHFASNVTTIHQFKTIKYQDFLPGLNEIKTIKNTGKESLPCYYNLAPLRVSYISFYKSTYNCKDIAEAVKIQARPSRSKCQ